MIRLTSVLILVFSLLTTNNHLVEKETITFSNDLDKEEIYSMIVPHHDLAEDMIDDMYKRVSSRKNSILLISPDHFLDGDRKITVGFKNWSTPNGIVKVNRFLTKDILRLDFVDQNDREIYKEHGINIHMPYIARYFPTCEIVTMMISKETSQTELDHLLSVLPDDLFVIASVDFSHYLDVESAYDKDEETLKVLERRALQDLFQMNDAYFDSPGALYMVMRYNSDEFTVFEHKNSFDYIGNWYMTTSYFTIGFQ